MAKMAVLERPGEENSLSRLSLQLLARRPEAHDDGACVNVLEGLEEEVNAFLLAQLPDVDDCAALAAEKVAEPVGVTGVGVALRAPRGIAPSLLQQRGQSLFARLRPKLVDIDPGRDDPHALGPAHDLLEHRADVLRAGENLR